ncbi:hypothetical protein K435DRAFT_802771 [Dendrothele bispora CBS 962.96]|uniref:Uncharacterized protein n=1 Tax=Dendrothele bispora (strain CBS 962.96) TaxID=1314807 RepID=A0A4S8LJW7_DENBC|nr:hypothetical protein K435DRAFT_802771 [Dendrothele bispora CBS 962.96]
MDAPWTQIGRKLDAPWTHWTHLDAHVDAKIWGPSADRREVEQVGSNWTEDTRREQKEGELDMGEAVGVELSQMPDKQGDRLSDVRVEGGKTDGRSEDTGEAGGSEDKSDHTQLMGDRSRAEDDRTEGKGEGTEIGMVADSGTSKMERHEDDGKKIEMGSVPRSGPIPDITGAREPAVDKGGNRDTDTEQRVTGRTGGKEDGADTGGLAGDGALQKEDSGDNEAQNAVTGMLPTISSLGDEDPKGYKDDGNQITNDQSQGEVDRTDREGESLDTTDSPEDGSQNNTTRSGSSRGGTASGTDIAG